MKNLLSVILSFFFISFLVSCEDDQEPTPPSISSRSFDMGFTTWSFGPNQQDVDDTYAFIGTNADIYAEHIDNRIPWSAWINDTALPSEFTNEIIGRADKRIAENKLLLSVSLLNSNRDELAEDFDGSIPTYSSLSDPTIEDAYFKHIDYLVTQFSPDYLVIAIEVNELRLRSPDKWDGYTTLIQNVTSRVKETHSSLNISESISLHNLYEPDIADADAYINDIVSHVNQLDFVAISYYPFLKNQSTTNEFQQTLDFLHNRVTPPIAFVESGHLAEDLIVPNLSVSIEGDPQGQNAFLETLLSNAEAQDYAFIIWWAHRDYDALWEVFPEEVRDIGQLWRDTGLLDEDGTERLSFETWKTAFNPE